MTGLKRTKVRRNDPCPCGSGVRWKYCCGKGVEGKSTTLTGYQLRNVRPFRFFLMDMARLLPVRDNQGRILVFQTQASALKIIDQHSLQMMQVCGMGVDKWVQFQDLEDYIEVQYNDEILPPEPQEEEGATQEE